MSRSQPRKKKHPLGYSAAFETTIRSTIAELDTALKTTAQVLNGELEIPPPARSMWQYWCVQLVQFVPKWRLHQDLLQLVPDIQATRAQLKVMKEEARIRYAFELAKLPKLLLERQKSRRVPVRHDLQAAS